MSGRTDGLYVYGIVPAGVPEDALQRDDLPGVWLVEADDLAVIVSEAPAEEDEAARERALAHIRVLRAAIDEASVVPFRFGTVFPDEEQLRSELLQQRRDELTRLMKKVEGCVQMTVKAYYDENGLLADIVEHDPEIAQLREATRGGEDTSTYNDRVRLGELVTRAIEQRQEQDLARIVGHLNPFALASVVEPLEKELMAANAPFLVERSRAREFETAVEEIAQQHSGVMRFKLLGPIPAYHFIDMEEPAWA